MSDWNFLNQHRISASNNRGEPAQFWSDESYGCNGMFTFFVEGVRVRCIASDGEGWKHVSVSLIGDFRPPKWDVMCAVKDLFFEPEDWVVQFHPAKSEYVNNHPGCLHLWMCLDQRFPTPDARMVGIK